MAKATLHLVRHAQGFHNLNAANHALPDPDLTPLGEEQCKTLSQAFPEGFPTAPRITHLVASPLRRTLYTCLLSFPTEVERGLIVTALPELQETSNLPCDTGSEPSKLAEEFGTKVDLSLVKEGWNNKTGRWSPAASAVSARAKDARIWLRELAEKAMKESGKDVEIVVVTHGGYLHYFTEDWDGYTSSMGTGWVNTEFRSFEFVGDDTEASILETKQSRERRRGSEKRLTKDEQRELRAAAEAEGLSNGYINQEDAKL